MAKMDDAYRGIAKFLHEVMTSPAHNHQDLIFHKDCLRCQRAAETEKRNG